LSYPQQRKQAGEKLWQQPGGRGAFCSATPQPTRLSRHMKPQAPAAALSRAEPLAARVLQVLSFPLAKAWLCIPLLDVGNDSCAACSARN